MNGELKYTEYNRITNMSTFRPVFADEMVYLFFLLGYSLLVKELYS